MTWYNTALAALMGGTLDLTTGTFKVALCSSGYTPNTDTHDFFDDVTNVLATVTLVSPSVTGRNFDPGADQTITDPGSGTVAVAVLYKDTGVDTTSPVIGYETGLSHIFDGTDDTIDLPATYLLRLGGA